MAQVLAVVSRSPLAQVSHVFTFPAQVAQFVLHTSQVLAEDENIVVPTGQLATHVLESLFKIKGEVH